MGCGVIECDDREYASFRMDSTGELQGVGLLIASDPSSGKIVVLAPLRGSPAEKAGIMPGDEVTLACDLLKLILVFLASQHQRSFNAWRRWKGGCQVVERERWNDRVCQIGS